MKTFSDVQVANLDLYLGSLIEDITVDQRRKIPLEISFKLFGSNSKNSLSKLTFFEKWFMLFRVFDKEIYFFVRDVENGMTSQDFEFIKDRVKPDIETAKLLVSKGDFVLSNNEFSDALFYTAKTAISSAYNYAISLKNKKKWRVGDSTRKLRFFINLIFQYEANKKIMLRQNDTALAGMYILQYLYDGQYKSSTDLYDGIFKGAPGCSRRTFMDAFRKMKHSGYIQMSGTDKTAVYSITILGKNFLHELILKYVVPQ